MRNVSFSKTFITANNKKLGNWFHSFAAKYHAGAFLKLLSNLVALSKKRDR